jgi:hypothetical protein
MFSLVVLSALALASPGDDCLSYSKQATVTGVLSLAPRPAQSPGNALAPAGREEFFFVLLPQAPVCVKAGNNADGLEPEIRALNVEVGVTNAPTFRMLRAMIGRSVVCTGNIASPRVTHHLRSADLLLWSPRCTGA